MNLKEKKEKELNEPTDFAMDNSSTEELKRFRAVKCKTDVNRFTGRRFHLTIHGQRNEDLVRLREFFDSDSWTKREILGENEYFGSDDEANKRNFVSCAVIAREYGRYKIHPHWQIYFELDSRTGMMLVLESVLGHNAFHLEKAKSTSSASIAYVYAVDKPYECGFVVYNKNAQVPERYDDSAVKFWNNFVPRPFQKALITLSKVTPDRRRIYYVHEPVGNTGKSILIEYLHIFHGAVVTGGSSADMKYAVDRWSQITGAYPVFICMDVARSERLTNETYKAIEAIKNGLFFTGKYESVMTHSFVKPHVLIFSNEAPKIENFSHDRWEIFTINKNYELKDKNGNIVSEL